MASVKEKFIKWLISNKVCDKDNKITIDDDTKISIDNGIKLLEQLSNKMINRINKGIFDINNYKEAKLFVDLYYYENKKYVNGRKSQCIYSELLNLFLKFEYTTYEKKNNNLNNIIYSFNHEDIDISRIYLYSDLIYSELCKWPYVYTIVDKNNNYVNITIKKNYNILCIPMYTDRKYIDSKYLSNDYKIKKEKFNLFLKKIDDKLDKIYPASIVIDPNYENDKVFIDVEELFWYYYPDTSNYF